MEISPEKYLTTIARLLNTNWIARIQGFRGLYYVLDSEERQKEFYKLDNFQILIKALITRFGTEWYFGRITAASLSGLINQPVSTYYIINKKTSKTIDSKLFGKLVLIKISGNFGKIYGITANEYRGTQYFISSTERNLSDYLYLYVHGYAEKEQIKALYNGSSGLIDKSKVIELIFKCYPRRSALKMISVFRSVSQ